jgi:hypothetical protein
MILAQYDINWFGSLAQIVGSIAAVLGAGAAAIFFWKRREYAPRVQFDLKMRIIGERPKELLIELVAIVHNVGLVRHRIKSMTFSVRGLRPDDPWVENPTKNGLIDFAHPVVTKQSWFPEIWNEPVKPGVTSGTFVEPGVIQIYPYNIRITTDLAYLLVYAHMDYRGSKDDHVAMMTASIAELRAAYLQSTEEGARRIMP